MCVSSSDVAGSGSARGDTPAVYIEAGKCLWGGK
jgi:hypothetical protein